MSAGATYSAEFVDDGGVARFQGSLAFTDSTDQPQPSSNPQTSGALATTTFVSGTGKQILTTRQVALYVPVTFDATNNVATCAVALSPDNTTYSTVATISLAAAVNTVGAIVEMLSLIVPQGWYVKFTASHCTVGTGSYA